MLSVLLGAERAETAVLGSVRRMLQRVPGKRRGERGRVALSILDGHPRQRRLVGLALTAVVIEIGLLVIAWFGPAFRVLLRPVYVWWRRSSCG
jgi:hypothetical protein